MMSSTMPSAKYSCSGSPLMFWNGSTAIDGLSGSGSGARRRSVAAACALGELDDAIDAHRPRDVLDLLLAQIRRRRCRACRATCSRTTAADADPAGLGQRFEPRGDVDAVAEDVAVLDDDVAEIDADAKFDAPLCRGRRRCARAIPRCTSTAQRTASTTLANSTSSPSPVVLTMRPRCSAILGSTSSRRCALKAASVPFLVPPHQPRIAGDIGRQDRRQSALDPLFAHGSPAGEKILLRVGWNLPLRERRFAGSRFEPRYEWELPVICGARD